ncbi:hypothetical protein WJX77_008132 [Trebouxia sp. C0004]
MGGVPFAFVANLQFQNFLHCLRPSFVPPGLIMLRGSLLDGLHGEILVQHAAWLADEKLRFSGEHLPTYYRVQVHDALFFYMHGISDGP